MKTNVWTKVLSIAPLISEIMQKILFEVDPRVIVLKNIQLARHILFTTSSALALVNEE